MYQLNPQETFYWIAEILSGKTDVDFKYQIENAITTGKINWEIFLKICDKHIVLPQVYKAFEKINLIKILPVSVSNELSEIYELNTLKNLKLFEQVDTINRILNFHNIQPIYLKGTANLLDGLYETPGERYIGDIDILIPEEKFLQVAILFHRIGYKARTKFNESGFYGMKHFPRLTHPDWPADVEVHKLLANPPYHKYFNYAYVEKLKKEIFRNGHLCFVFSDQHKVLHNFIHSQLNDRGAFRANPSLRQMYDLMLLDERTNILPCFRKFGYYLIKAKNYLALTRYLFKKDDPDNLTQSINFKLYKLRFNSVLQSPELLSYFEKLDKKLNPVRYYAFYVVPRLRSEKNYRNMHLKRLLRKLPLN